MVPDRVLVVCTGNVCRSPYIEFTLRQALGNGLRIASAGTDALAGQSIDPGTAELLAAEDIDPAGFVARQLTAEMVREAALILTATRAQRSQVVRTDMSGLRKTFALIDFSDIVARLDVGRLEPSFMDPPDLSDLALLVSGCARHLGSITPRAVSAADIVDPFGQSQRVHKQMKQTVDAALVPVIAALK